MTDQEPLITLQLRASRLEYIANVLAQRPYAEVAAILADLQQQLQAQQQPQQATLQPKGNGLDTTVQQ